MIARTFSFVAVLSVVRFVATSTPLPAVTAQSGNGTLSVTSAFSPNPPTSHGDDTIVVTVKDAAGHPVRGAKVKIATSMPTISMKGGDLVAKDHGDGTYMAVTKLAYATKWAFDITAESKGHHGATRVERELK